MLSTIRRLYRPILYVALGITALLWGLHFIISWQKTELRNVVSNDSAQIYSINAALNQLPDPSTIKPQISGDLPGQITTITTLADSVDQANLSTPTLLQKIFVRGNSNQLNDSRGQIVKTLQSLGRDLRQYQSTLQSLKKFIEYSPSTDLADFDPNDSIETERLDRAKAGIAKTGEDIANATIPQIEAIKVQLDTVITRSNGVKTKQDIALWSETVKVAQLQILKLLSDTPKVIITTHSPNLLDQANQYAEIKVK